MSPIPEKFSRLSLRQRFLVAPFLGLVLLGLLMAVFIYESQRQNALLMRVAERELAVFDRYSAVFVNLSAQHVALYALLNDTRKTDEETLYESAKTRLYAIHDAVGQLEKMVPPDTGDLGDDSSFRSARKDVLDLAQTYRKTVISAVDTTTHNAKLAPAFTALANERFIAMNRAFAKLLDMQQQGLAAEIIAGVGHSRTTLTGFALIGIVVAALLLTLSFWLSRLLSRSLETQIGALSQLTGRAGEAPKVEGADEVERIGNAIATFKRAQLELRESEERYRELVELSPDAIYLSSDGIITFANGACVRVLGASSPEDLIGKQVLDITHPDFHDVIRERRRLMKEYDQPLPPSVQKKLRLDGTPVDVEVMAGPFVYKGMRGVQVVMRDITERKRAEEELARTNAELEKFVLVASHDLQEPLRTTANAALLLDERHGEKLVGEAKELLGYVVSGVMNMRRLIDALLVFSGIGAKPAAIAATDCRAVMTDVLANLRAVIEESGAIVDCGPLPVVRADPSQLEQVFMNLISNAIKFRGNGALQIQVEAHREDSDWVISVTDNGIGINPAYAEKVFEIFERLDAHYPGTGVGLAICKKIVESNNGRIWVESQEGKGAKFSFTVPAADASKRPNA
jgi:PAS domain S-box-containing protein